MKFIKIKDTFPENSFRDTDDDLSFVVAVDDYNYQTVVDTIKYVIQNAKENHYDVEKEIVDRTKAFGGYIVRPDIELEVDICNYEDNDNEDEEYKWYKVGYYDDRHDGYVFSKTYEAEDESEAEQMFYNDIENRDAIEEFDDVYPFLITEED